MLPQMKLTQLLCLAALSLQACRPAADDFSARPHIDVTSELDSCARFVDAYVGSRRGWSEDEYKITSEAYPSAGAMFRISHVDDWSTSRSQLGGGMSFFVEVDCSRRVVLRELDQQ
jgi:hypothetical protein